MATLPARAFVCETCRPDGLGHTGRLLKLAETRRYVADYEGAPIELADAREMVAQADAFIAAVRATLA